MKLGVDGIIALESLHTRIYDDAADDGIPFTDENNKILKRIIQNEFEGFEDSQFDPNQKPSTVIKQQRYWCPIEQDGGVTRGLLVTIKLHKMSFNPSVINAFDYKAPAYYKVNVNYVAR